MNLTVDLAEMLVLLEKHVVLAHVSLPVLSRQTKPIAELAETLVLPEKRVALEWKMAH